MGRKPITHLYFRRRASSFGPRKYVYYRWDPQYDKLIYFLDKQVKEPTGSQKRGYAYIRIRVEDHIIVPVNIEDVPIGILERFEAYSG